MQKRVNVLNQEQWTFVGVVQNQIRKAYTSCNKQMTDQKWESLAKWLENKREEINEKWNSWIVTEKAMDAILSTVEEIEVDWRKQHINTAQN